MGVLYDQINVKASGGTELVMRGMESIVDPGLLEQVYVSRTLSTLIQGPKDKPRIFWAHDVAPTHKTDPFEYSQIIQNRWKEFDRIVFVSNWQMLEYVKMFQFLWTDWNKIRVIHNAIHPIPEHTKPTDKIRLIYTSNPIRGLDILYKAFEKVAKNNPDIELEVFSSSKLYNLPHQTDDQFAELFKKLQDHPQIIHHGATTNALVREGLMRSHIFAYPSTWGETSCLSLIEAMSAGLLCVHPNHSALFETASNWTNMYHYDSDKEAHTEKFAEHLEKAIQQYRNGDISHLQQQAQYANYAHNWERIGKEWESFISETMGN